MQVEGMGQMKNSIPEWGRGGGFGYEANTLTSERNI
jgi:hypothetical protein